MKSGYYVKNLSGEMSYSSFYPNSLQSIDLGDFDYRTIELLIKANYELGRLNGLASNIVDINKFISCFS